MEVTTIEELQEKVGLFEPNNPLGIIYQSIEYTEMYDLLKDYLVSADFHMYYKYGNRILMRKYDHAFVLNNIGRIKQAILYALVADEYRLKTLIATTKIEYNPIDNYDITETIVTTATISANIIKGSQSNKKSISEIKTTDGGTNTIQHGQQKQTGSETNNYGEQTNTKTETTDWGDKNTTTNNTLTVSPYNIDQYKPKEKNDGAEKIQAYTDINTTDETIGKRTDTISTSKTSNQYTDSETKNNTRTQTPYDISDTIGERTDKNDRNDDINRERHAKGRYGYTTTQSLIEAERKIADLSIVEEIIKIVLSTICNNVLYME